MRFLVGFLNSLKIAICSFRVKLIHKNRPEWLLQTFSRQHLLVKSMLMKRTVLLFTYEWEIWTYYSILKSIISLKFWLMVYLSTLYSRSVLSECLPNLFRFYFLLNLYWKLHSLGLNLNCVTRLSRKIFQSRVII